MGAEERYSSSFQFHATVLILWILTLFFGWHSVRSFSIYLATNPIPNNSKSVVANQQQHQSVADSEFDSESDSSSLHFCRVPKVQHKNATLNLLYQCSGRPYEQFVNELYLLAKQQEHEHEHEHDQEHEHPQASSRSHHHKKSPISNATSYSHWGKRRFPLPDNTTVLLLGNSHLRQISKTLMCQYSHMIDHISVGVEASPESFTLKFSNNATWISITNTVLVYSHEWNKLVEEYFLLENPLVTRLFESMDALVFGKFTQYKEALHTNFETTMKREQEYYLGLADPTTSTRTTTTTENAVVIDFATIPPPQLVDAARIFPEKPILSVSMFASTDIDRAKSSHAVYRQQYPNRTNVAFVDARQYIDRLGLECGSDDKLTMGTCHEPGDIVRNSNRNPADMHRCAGPQGGHADLIAWDVIEKLYELID